MVGKSLMSKNCAIEPSLHTKQVLQETNHYFIPNKCKSMSCESRLQISHSRVYLSNKNF